MKTPPTYAASVAAVRSSWAWATARPVRSLTAAGLAIGVIAAILVPPMGLALWGGAHAISWIVALVVVPLGALIGNWIGLLASLGLKRRRSPYGQLLIRKSRKRPTDTGVTNPQAQVVTKHIQK